MECATEVEKHKKSLSDLDNRRRFCANDQLVKKEVSLLVEEKMRLCEKIGSLTESCALKDHLNEYGLTLCWT